MATLLFARSWDRGDAMLNGVDTSDLSAHIASTTQKKTGAYSLRCGGDLGRWARWRLPGDPNNPSVSLWVHPGHLDLFNSDGDGTSGLNFRLRLGTGEYIDLRWKASTHTFDAWVDGVLVLSGTIEVAAFDWFHVQWYVVIDNAGSIGVKINGHQSIDYSGDTQPGAATGADYFYAWGGLSGSRYFYIDDLVGGYGGFLGALNCYEMVPNGDTGRTDWTPLGASDNYEMIDETPASDADYNESDANGEKDVLELSDVDYATLERSPVALFPWVRAKMEEGTGDSIKVGLDSNGTEGVTEHALSGAYQYYWHTAIEDPDAGGKPWEAASANAVKLVYESVIT